MEQTRAMTSDRDRYGRAALHYAVLDGRTADVEQLLNDGADPNVADKEGQTPLHFAAQEYRPAEAALLCSAGAAVDVCDKHGNSPLFRATFDSRGRADVILILLGNGANADLANKSGVTPRQLAERISNYDVLRFFGV
jgi:ankyrin repeat protein